jgi:hypothetical protein
MNKRNITLPAMLLGILLIALPAFAQKSIREYVDKTDSEKIKSSIVIGLRPVTAAGYGDGHGSTPLLTSKNQIPDTIALVSFYIYDLGSYTVSQGGNVVATTYTSVSEKGGNILANEILSKSIADLRAGYLRNGIVLLTPEEFLDTEEKRNFYYNEFVPNVSKMGNFLSNLETRHQDIAVTADYYRPLDVAAAHDHLRAESLGYDLATRLGVDGVMISATELQSSSKVVNIHGFKMSLHGPNPIPKEDKDYIGQKTGTGYYNGNAYASGTFYFKQPIQVAEWEKKQMVNINFDGIGVILGCFPEAFFEAMVESIEKAAPKYNK